MKNIINHGAYFIDAISLSVLSESSCMRQLIDITRTCDKAKKYAALYRI